jgi:hypothetical protein
MPHKVTAPFVCLFDKDVDITYREIQTVERQIFIKNRGPFKLYKVLSIVEELEDTDGFFKFVVIHDDNLREALEEIGVCMTNIRGASYKASAGKRIAFENFLMDLTYEPDKVTVVEK